MVAQAPPKRLVWVRVLWNLHFGVIVQLGERYTCNVEVAGSKPVDSIFARLTQLGECIAYTDEVKGSSPLASTIRLYGIKVYYDRLSLG